ncbi:family 26 endoglucanase H/Glycosyl hydrolase [Xylariales sp. AK1849]|nr:family 26 endoglucanase H/Glycosyl hydrolase [Xylariales sp. AK1849]
MLAVPFHLTEDFLDYAPSAVANGATGTDVDTAIQNDKARGVQYLRLHLRLALDRPRGLWYSGFYTKATSLDLASALGEGTDGANYKLLLRNIDTIAVQIKKLQVAGVPILFRPLHEPDGPWVW